VLSVRRPTAPGRQHRRILGHPLRSLVAAARISAAAGEPLQAGWIVMAGGATAAEALAPASMCAAKCSTRPCRIHTTK
jgi:2-oxo-3-hexenedioate decarboxylase